MSDRQKVRDAVDNLVETLYEETTVEDYSPTRDRVLIYPIVEKKAQTGGGLWVPDEDKAKKGLVLATGPGMRTKNGRVKPDVQKGDVVVMGGWIGELLRLGNEEFRLVRAGDILMVLHDHEDVDVGK